MMNLLVFKERLRQFYSKNDFYLIPAAKFVLALVTLLVLNQYIGFSAPLKNLAVVIIIALLCSFIPMSLTVALMAAFILGHVMELSIELAAIMLLLLLVMYLGYYRFAARDGIVLILMPILMILKVPYLMPLLVGLVATPASVISVAFGTMLYYSLYFISENTLRITNLSTDDLLTKIHMFMEGLFANPDMYVAMVVFACVVIVVYLIRRLPINYSWSIAIVTGSIVNVAGFLVGGMLVKSSSVSMGALLLGTLLSMAIAFLINFCVFSVDYSRTEHAQFEDDDYYYYVKAVPKISVTTPDVRVKRINARRSRHPRTTERGTGSRTAASRNSRQRVTASSERNARRATGQTPRQPSGRE